MHLVPKLKTGAAAVVVATAVFAVAGLLVTSGARTEELKHYDSNNKSFGPIRPMTGSWAMRPRN